jgi:hypothetical protein
LLVVALLGVVLWRGGFGVLPIDRELVWQLPVSYADVRAVDLQVWDGETLLTRQQRRFEHGVSEELRTTAPLVRGTKRFQAAVELVDGGTPGWSVEKDPADERTVVVRPPSRSP